MKTIKLFFLLLSFVAGLASLTSCGDNEPEPMPVAKAPVFVMNENFTITATCPNSYMAFINGVEKTLPYTVTQTYQQQIIVVKGYGYGEGMQNSDTVEQTFSVPAMEMPKAEAPVFAMNESFEITATCANSYKAYVNGIETVLPYTVTQTYQQQNIVVSGYGYGINLQNSDTVEQSFVVPAKHFDEYVDLGLPSGTLWATRNIGANSPVEYGDYFAWGETEPKDNYIWDNYKWVNVIRGSLHFTKYCMNSAEGDVDSKDQLDLEDDAAYVNWGPEWRMPTRDQIHELMDNCTAEWIQMNGVNGELITGPNGKTIFLPAAGYWVNKLFLAGEGGYYWGCSMLFVPPTHYYSQLGTSIRFDVEWWDRNSGSRCAGFTVRPVRASQD